MAESSNTDAAVFWPEGKISTFAEFLERFFRQLELNDLSLLFGFHLVPQVSDILLPHPSLSNSFCLGPHFHESPTDLISCEANRIPFVSQDLELDSWADSLRA
jgi:hypothetical protein